MASAREPTPEELIEVDLAPVIFGSIKSSLENCQSLTSPNVLGLPETEPIEAGYKMYDNEGPAYLILTRKNASEFFLTLGMGDPNDVYDFTVSKFYLSDYNLFARNGKDWEAAIKEAKVVDDILGRFLKIGEYVDSRVVPHPRGWLEDVPIMSNPEEPW